MFLFRALRHRNFRLFFAGQGISLVGTWMQRIALSWLVYRLTDSVMLLGLVSFVNEIPVLLLSPFAGVFADRWNRRRTLIITQSFSVLQAFALAFLVLTNTIEVWHIIVLGFVQGGVHAFDTPTRQSFMIEMIEKKEDLGNAIALNSSMLNGSRLIGPSLAGIIIAVAGEGIVFLLNGISYGAVIASLLAMRLAPAVAGQKKGRILRDLKEGFSYAVGFPPIRYILLLLVLVSVMAMPYTVLMPVFAQDVLGGGARTLGFLSGASGLGALVGALYLASRKSPRGLLRMIPVACGLFGAGLIAFAFSKMVMLSLVLMAVTGFWMIMQMASSNTVLQTIVDDDKRGRVMSFHFIAFRGMVPFGSLLAGVLASAIGVSYTVMLGGAACILGALLFATKLPLLRTSIRPIYERIGIIVPESS